MAFKLYARNGGVSNAKVSGSVYYRNGSFVIPEQQIKKSQNEKRVGYIVVKEHGNVSFSARYEGLK